MQELTKKQLVNIEGGNDSVDDGVAIGLGLLGIITSGGTASAVVAMASMVYELADEGRSYNPNDPNVYRA
ncbi:MAG: hypothetical protein FXF54_14560 [Kosmotoga sp.]|nr:MAG: hypothetical protein FXF54_14560 [Kosmotoga sp.]